MTVRASPAEQGPSEFLLITAMLSLQDWHRNEGNGQREELGKSLELPDALPWIFLDRSSVCVKPLSLWFKLGNTFL